MNALDILYKIRACDRYGRFTYDDTELLNDLTEMLQSAESSARQIALEQALRIVREILGARDEICGEIEKL